jgi:hypothetical protein
LDDEVGTATQIEAQVDVVAPIGKEGRPQL